MKYQKTVQLWGAESLLRSGELRLQPGQWVQCGRDSALARYVGIRGNSIWVAHGTDTPCTLKEFLNQLRAFGTVRQRERKFRKGTR